MADLVLDWGLLGAYGTQLGDGTFGGVPVTVDTGGVGVEIAFASQDTNAQALTFDADGYVAPDETFDPKSWLKLFGEGGSGGPGESPTSTTVLSFAALDTDLYTDSVQNVAFRLSDIDADETGEDIDGIDAEGLSFEDNVTILAYDGAGNEVAVSLTPSGAPAVAGNTATGTTETEFTDADGSLLVEIAGPVSRIEIVYENGGNGQQAALVSDIEFSTIDVDPGNLDPDAVDDLATTDMDTAIIIDVVANDSDPEGGALTVTFLSDPTDGEVVDNGDGTVTYTPDTGFVGSDTFEYEISDPQGNSDTAVVTVEVGDPNDPPVAVDDIATTGIGAPVIIDVTANDSDPDGDDFSIIFLTSPANGTVEDNGDGTVTYTPDAGFFGVDTFEYDIADSSGGSDTGLVTVSVEQDERIDTDVFPVDPADQALDPLDGLDEDPDPADDLDDITGTSSSDLISTGDDNDTIDAGGGDDSVMPGIDDDLVELGAGDDSLFDSQGADTIYGRTGNDSIIAGTNTFSDYVGDDLAFAPGTLLNTLGFDSDPNQDDGRDYVEGNRGDDYIATGDDRDTLDGGGENDTLDGGIDDDSIMGGQGDDSLIGSHGADTLDGGQGDDTLDGSNLASLELTDDIDVNTENDRDFLDGETGNDLLIGGDDNDTLYGDSGEDTLNGGSDDDVLFGGNDSDTLLGGQGDDSLDGGRGIDSIDGGADRDIIYVSSAEEGAGDFVTGNNTGDDFDTLDLSGVGQEDVDWRLVNVRDDDDGARPSNGIDGTVEFLNGAGEVTGTMDFENIEEIVPCFTPGTLIATPEGERLVEDLKPGDRVITRDNGIQRIRWTGRKDLTGHDLARQPHLRPVLIQKGALGRNLPEHDLLVSPNHRVLVNNDKTALYFEETEVLAAAKHLTGLDRVDEVGTLGVAYIHIMFDRHEVVLSNGAWTESFQPGDYSLRGIGAAQRQEILDLFPELAEAEGRDAYQSARRSLKKHEAALLTK